MYMQEKLDVHAGKTRCTCRKNGMTCRKGQTADACPRRGPPCCTLHGTGAFAAWNKGAAAAKKLFIRQSVSLLYSYLRPEYRERPSNDPPPRAPTLRRRAAVWAPRDPASAAAPDSGSPLSQLRPPSGHGYHSHPPIPLYERLLPRHEEIREPLQAIPCKIGRAHV